MASKLLILVSFICATAFGEVIEPGDLEQFKEVLFEKDEIRQAAIGPYPQSCEELQYWNQNHDNIGQQTAVFTGEVHLEETGFSMVESDINCNFEDLPDLPDLELDLNSNQTEGQEVYPRDCSDVLMRNRNSSSGQFTIFHPDWTHSTPGGFYLLPIQVYCDMDTAGGGWTVFQRRQDGSEDFYRGWADYDLGFGNVSAEFWLGLRFINMLTADREQNLFVRMQGRLDPSNWSYAMYHDFSVSDSNDNYRLNLGCYVGNDTFGDRMTGTNHNMNGMQFSTHDNDNDLSSSNCARSWRSGYWFNACAHNNLNGIYSLPSSTDAIWWGRHFSDEDVKSFVTMAFKPLHLW